MGAWKSQAAGLCALLPVGFLQLGRALLSFLSAQLRVLWVPGISAAGRRSSAPAPSPALIWGLGGAQGLFPGLASLLCLI